jgi:hypothetical protein
VSREIGDV